MSDGHTSAERAGGTVPGPVRVRFAPSPTGTLHIGSARTALYNYLFARHLGGTYILRIEDTDVARSHPEHEQSIMRDLAWLGLEWDEGPDIGGPAGPYRQSERVREGIYRQAAQRLLDEGKAYYCFCSQERLEQLKQETLARGEMPKYDRRCAALAREEAAARVETGEAATIRFGVPDIGITVTDIIHGRTDFSSEVIGDFIIMRSDGGVSYNFAVVVDDIAMGITHVIRGEDHLTNAARQVLVFEALGHEPPAWAHHSLIMGPDGGKLSKRHGATSVGDFRDMGYLPSAIINYLALLSWSPGEEREKLSKAEMVGEFELQRVSKSPAIFDIQKLDWLNGKYIRDLTPVDLHQALEPYLDQIGQDKGDGRRAIAGLDVEAEQLAVAELALQTSMATLGDAVRLLPEFFTLTELEGSEAVEELRDQQAAAVIDLALERYGAIYGSETASGSEPAPGGASASAEPASGEAMIVKAQQVIQEMKKACKEAEIPAKRLYRTLRIALTGRTSGPELPFLLAGLGRETVRQRLESARKFTG